MEWYSEVLEVQAHLRQHTLFPVGYCLGLYPVSLGLLSKD